RVRPDCASLHPGYACSGAPRPALSKVSAITIIYFPKPAEKPPVARPNDDEINPVNRPGVVLFSTGGMPRRPSQSREKIPCPNVLHCCPPPCSAHSLSPPPSPRPPARKKGP